MERGSVVDAQTDFNEVYLCLYKKKYKLPDLPSSIRQLLDWEVVMLLDVMRKHERLKQIQRMAIMQSL
jgi:hypothetical protein